jgi:hypothetical protein
MSAYIVDKNHILFLLAAMTSRTIGRNYGFSYYHEPNGERVKVVDGDCEQIAQIGNLLWRENIASVSARYSDKTSATLPGPRGGSFEVTAQDVARAHYNRIDPLHVLKSCACYEYQSCEHAGWKTSEAHAIIADLERAAWQSLPGYDDAPWGAPEQIPGGVRLTSLIRRKI